MADNTAKIKYLENEDGVKWLPVTHERAVLDSEGTNLETKLAGKQATLVSGTNIKTINNESILGSGNINLQTKLTVDPIPVPESINPVMSGGVFTSLDGKQDTLSFDIIPTFGSTNPVESSGIYNALATKEISSNKVTSLSPSSTNEQYPSALCVYTLISGLTSPFTYEIVSSLPTASAETLGKIYVLTDLSASTFYLTAEDSDSYSWEEIGEMATSISTITDGEIDSLFDNE